MESPLPALVAEWYAADRRAVEWGDPPLGDPIVVETFPPQTLFGKPVVVDPSLPEVNPTYGMVNFPELAEGE
jgi:hypothetical protein